MNILVCVKQVPDTTEIRIDPVKNTLACVPQIDTMHPWRSEGAFLTIAPTQKAIGCIGARMGDFCLRKFGIEWLAISLL